MDAPSFVAQLDILFSLHRRMGAATEPFLSAGRIGRPHGLDGSFHVLEAVDPATALIEYAQKNEVDEIVVGARASSALRRADS